MSKPRLLYIGHAGHQKTKSTVFLLDLLATRYEVFRMDVATPMEKIPEARVAALGVREFDVLVVFQMWIDLARLGRLITYRHGVWFPMYDGLPPEDHPFLAEIRGFNIINFSHLVHERLLRRGYASHYVQYFPRPTEAPVFGDEDTVYLWQRRNEIGMNLVETLFRGTPLKKVHLHKVLDPGHEFTGIPQSLESRTEVSTWYDTRELMQEDQKRFAYYVAPRLYEGIGMGFLEAMAMGKCVIASDHPTANEYIVDGVNGILYDAAVPRPIRMDLPLRVIQRNSWEFCQVGYRAWLRKRWQILDWCEAPVHLVEGNGATVTTGRAVRIVLKNLLRSPFHLLPHRVRYALNRLAGRRR